MGAGTVTITMTAQQASVVQAFLNVHNLADKTAGKLGAIGGAADRARGQAGGFLAGLSGDLGKAALAFAGVGTTIAAIGTSAGLLMKEYERFRSTRMGTADLFEDIERSKERVALVVSGQRQRGEMTDQGYQDLLEHITVSGGMAGFDENRMGAAFRFYEAAESAGASVVGPNAARDIVREILGTFGGTMVAGSEDEFRRMSGAIVDYMKTLPAEERNAKTVVGHILAANPVTRIEGPEHIHNILRGVTSWIEAGEPRMSAWATAGTVGSKMLDEAGRRTSNFMIRFAEQMPQVAVELGKFGATQQQIRDFSALSPTEQKDTIIRGFEQGATSFERMLATRFAGVEGLAMRPDTPRNRRMMDEAQALGWEKMAIEIEAPARSSVLSMFGMSKGQGIPFEEAYANALKQMQAAETPAGAQKLVDDTLGRRSPELQSLIRLKGSRGMTAARVKDQALQGASMDFMQKYGELTGTGAVESMLDNFFSTVDATQFKGRPTAARRSQLKMLKAKMLGNEIGIFERLGDAAIPSLRRRVTEEELRGRMTEQERLLYGDIERELGVLPADEAIPGSPAAAAGRAGAKIPQGVVPRGANKPRANQGSGIDRLADKIAAAVSRGSGTYTLRIEDMAGRPLTRARSLPRPIERLG